MEDRAALTSSGGAGSAALQTVFEDPISMEIMSNAVVLTGCGHSFSEATLEGWLGAGKQYCPMCQAAVRGPHAVKPNFTLREAIAQYQRVRKDHVEKTLAQEEAEIRTAVQTAPAAPRDMSTWAQINAGGDAVDDYRLLVEVTGALGVERADKRDLHVVARLRGAERRTGAARSAAQPAWRGDMLCWSLDERAVAEGAAAPGGTTAPPAAASAAAANDDCVVLALVEVTGLLFGKSEPLASARVALRDIVRARRLCTVLPLLATAPPGARAPPRMALAVTCHVVNMRYASTVLHTAELANAAAYSAGARADNSNNSAEAARAAAAEEARLLRARLVALGSEAGAAATRATATQRAVSVPVARRPLPTPSPPPPPPATLGELDRKVRNLMEMGFDGERARTALMANGGDEEDAVMRMVDL